GGDDLAGGPDIADQPRGLAAGRAAVLDVARLARADRGGLAHPLELHGERLDVGLALLPLPRERVADLTIGLAGHRARHHRALLVDGDHLLARVLGTVRRGT